MSAFRAAVRQAAVDLLSAYAQAADIKLQIYPGRPRSIAAPTAFVDTITQTVNYDAQRELVVRAIVVILHGEFDSKDTAAQADTFVDDFIDWVWDPANFHAAGDSTSLAVVGAEDDATYTPEWLPLERQKTYFATYLTLEGRTYG